MGVKGCEIVDGLGYWCVHMQDASLVEIELHAISAGVLLKSREYLLKDDCRFRKQYYIIRVCEF